MKVCIAAFLALALGVVPNLASAQGKSKAARIKEAKVHYNNARDHHEHKEYLAAADEYEKAYAIFPNPDYVFNAAQVHRLAGNLQIALDLYTKYLELDPEGRGAADARAFRATLEAEIAAAVAEAEAKSAEDKRIADEEASAEAKRLADEKAAAVAKSPANEKQQADIGATRTRQHEGSKSLRIAGLATFGAGALALGLGIKFGLDAKDLESRVQDNTIWSQADFDDGEAAERNTFIFYGVGAAAVTAGTVMYLMGRGSNDGASKEGRLTLLPVSARDSRGLQVRGSF